MISPIDPDLPLLATVLARQWQYPPGYERLMLEALTSNTPPRASPGSHRPRIAGEREDRTMTQPSVSLAALLDVARQMPPLIAADWLRDQPHGMAELCALHILARHYLPPDKCTHRWLDNDAYACVELRDHCITYYLVKDGMVERLDLSTDYTSPTFPLPRILSWRGSHIRGWDRSQDKSDHLNVVYYERLWEWVASDFEDWDMREPVVSPELAM